MALALHDHPLLSQNARVDGFEIGGDETSRSINGEQARSKEDWDGLITRAYSQLFFHTFKADRQSVLESQVRSGQISVREFIRGLALSPRFLQGVYACNGNKQVARHLVERLLGRQLHGEGEAIAWSIVIGERGVAAMVDALLDSEEYLNNFGDDQVPYQRKRVLAGQSVGLRPNNITLPRYEAYHRQVLASFPSGGGGFNPGGSSWGARPEFINWPNGMPPENIRKIWFGLIGIGALEVLRVVITSAAAALSS